MERRKMTDFVVRHYTEDDGPTFKGNGFDGIRVGDDREEAQQFADYINALRKDAERYRKLRDEGAALGLRGIFDLMPSKWNEVIDAAAPDDPADKEED